MASPSSPKSRSGSPTSRGGSAVAAPTTPSFFIIQEPTGMIRSTPPAPESTSKRNAPIATPSDIAARGDVERQRHALQPTHSLDSGTPGRRRLGKRTANSPTALHEETEHDLLVDEAGGERQHSSTSNAQLRVLSILNRCGSSPDLPLHNSWSAAVFSSSKKRQLLKPTNGTGASPHFTALQRSRLIPLPINIRTGARKKVDNEEVCSSPVAARTSSLLGSIREANHQPRPANADTEEERMNYEISIASLKHRLAHMEKEAAKSVKQRHALERQVDALTKAQQSVQGEKVQLIKNISELEATNMQQRLAFDKLSEKFSTVYSSLAKVNEIGTSTSSDDDHPTHVASLQAVIQMMARENQELQRKVRVLETRHAEHKTILRNQEKQIKRLRAEMEALQHMAGSKDESSSSSVLKTHQLGDSSAMTTKAMIASRADASPSCATVAGASSAVQTPSVGTDETAYVDPNILKVLEKVDSQFSITTAITLSSVLKKWLHSCLHIVASVDLHGVLQVLMKRVCELLHCHHAAIFHVDHSSKKLVSMASERGRVRWEMPLDKGILGHAARHNLLCNVRKAYDDPRFFSSSDTITGTKSREVLCIPLTRELDAFQSDPSSTVANSSVFAVLQCWNTSTQKPFTHNDQIAGGLLAIHAGVVLSQTRLSEDMQRVHNRVLQIARMAAELAPKAAITDNAQLAAAASGVDASAASVSIVHLVRAAQRKFAEIVGITKLRIFVLDSDVMRVWHVGAARLDAAATSSSDFQLTPVRKYASVHSSLCALMVGDATTVDTGGGLDTVQATPSTPSGCRILLEPTGEPTFNDTVDLKGGANGLYLAAIRSPWRELPLGMIQVARTGSALGLASMEGRPLSTAAKRERIRAQEVEDALTMELIDLFCQQFASLLHHATALQLHDMCPREVHEARLSHLTDRLDVLESEYLREQEEAEAEAEAMAQHNLAASLFEQKLLESMGEGERRMATPVVPNHSRPSSGINTHNQVNGIFDPVPLISTDSSYAIDISDADASPPDEDPNAASSRSPSDPSAF